MADPTSSSYFLHFPKVDVQFFRAFANSLAFFDKSHFLIVLEAFSMSLSVQQEQANSPDFLIHPSLFFLNISIAALHVFTSVIFGCGRLDGSQAL